jgi:hypothetical protein
MPSLKPDRVIQRRHKAAMTIISQINPEERPLLLAYVVGGSDRIRQLERVVESPLPDEPDPED